jgi:dephospho-CoA kinase
MRARAEMMILGLTGSIAMGKSTTAAMLRRLGVPVCDSDAIVHRAMAKGGVAVASVRRAFKGVAKDGAVDRAALGEVVFDDPKALRRLEAILHPLVFEAQTRFLKQAAARRERLAVLDVPLLFESGTDARCDAVIVVSAPRFLQAARALGRPGMDRNRLDSIMAHQMPDSEKRRRADFVVATGNGRRHTLQRLKTIVTMLSSRCGTKWPPPPPNRMQRVPADT